MPQILNSDIVCAFQKVIETKDILYLNGQAYTKDTFQPIPFKMNEFTGVNGAMSLKTTLNLSTACPETWPLATYLIMDDYDSSVQYVFTANTTTNVQCYTRVTKMVNDEIVLKTTNTAFYNFYQYLGQTKDLILMTQQYGNTPSGNYTGTIFSINKTTLVGTIIKNYGGSYNITKIIETDHYIYVCVVLFTTGQIAIERLNKLTNTVETLTTISQTTSWGGRINLVLNDIYKISDTVFYMYGMVNNPTSPFIKFIFDLEESNLSLIAIKETPTVEWNAEIKSQLDIFAFAQYNSYRTFINESENHTMLHVLAYQQALGNNATYATNTQGFYTFEINSEGNLKLVSFYKFLDEIIKGIILTENKKHVAIVTSTGVHFMLLIENKFVEINYLPKPIKSIGLDMYERFWITHTDDTVEMFYQNTPIDFQFEIPEYFSWQGSDIDTVLKISPIDLFGNIVSASITFTIDGPAVFIANETKEITIELSSLQPTTVGIRIQGEGQIMIYPEIVYYGEED